MIKYKATLQAKAAIGRPPNLPTVQVYLILENEIPKRFREITKRLRVSFLENVKPSLSDADREQRRASLQRDPELLDYLKESAQAGIFCRKKRA